ncbi:MAG: hypothetical protein H5T76_23080 [Streptomyces sp.]|nr:hypothetical protein [Streptomyces sp.]
MSYYDGNRLDGYLRKHLKDAHAELGRLDPDVLLSENVDVLIEVLVSKHLPTEINVDWDGVTSTGIDEVTIKVRDQFGRDRIYDAPASKTTLRFPASGSLEMLRYPASQAYMSTTLDFKIDERRDTIEVEITERELTAELIKQRIAGFREQVGNRVKWANADLAQVRDTAPSELRAAYEQRKDRITRDRHVQEALGIPVHTTGVPRRPVPARRKQVTLAARRSQEKFVPEPVLDEATYRDILEGVQGWARTLERTRRTTMKLDEEELRDLLLGTLNTYWEGSAGGELFNNNGKTDILVRSADRNAFIGECKIWSGPKAAGDAIDQLLGYLVWRDSKAALIMFIKTADPAATVDKLHRAIEDHPRHVLTKPSSDTSRQVDYILTADDEGRRISLAVIPVILPKE